MREAYNFGRGHGCVVGRTGFYAQFLLRVTGWVQLS